MNNTNFDKNGSTITIRVMCAIVFVLFAWGWLYFFQADALAMTQHVLSDGLTHYNRLVGAFIITAVLMILQSIVNGVTKLNKRFHALTYVPSMLVMALLTDISQSLDSGILFSNSFWLVILFAVIWVGLIFFVRQYQDVEKEIQFPLFSRSMWMNMLMMSVMIICVAWIGNTNAVFQYRMKVEGHLVRGEYPQALKVGKKSLESDADLLMLRMYALARCGEMGEHLFEYPITGNSSQVLPTNGKTKMLLCPTDSLYKFLGARPAVLMEPQRYFAMLQRRDSVNNKAIADYILCGYLIDKQLDCFAKEISHYYTIDAQLPKHYREALTLYTHSRSNPLVVCRIPVVEEDYANYQELKKKYQDPMEQKTRVSEEYRGTYWYFFEYE
jgi:hypothetical protein